MDNATRLERLNRLLDVALVHQEYEGRDTPLNGITCDLNMGHWASDPDMQCGSSACLLGSYALTEYGKQFFGWDGTVMPEPELLSPEGEHDDPYAHAAEHFGIDEEDSRFLFDPGEYDFTIPEAVVCHVRQVIAKYSDFNVQGVTSGRWSSRY